MLFFLIPFVIQVLILFFYVIPGEFAIYGSNDDGLIASFSVDRSLNMDSDNWIFIKSLLSIPATLLQQALPSAGVFGFILAITVILSISSIFPLVYFVNSTLHKILLLVIMSIILSIFFLFSMLAPTYTGAALYSGASGFAIILFLLRSNTKYNSDLLILAGFLLSLSYLIRLESFLLTLGFFLVLIVFDLVVFKKPNKDINIFGIPSIFLVVVFCLNFLLEQANYNDEKWRDYLELNEQRHSIQLRTAEYEMENHISKFDWSKYDYSMFRKFSLADPQKLNKESLQIAYDATGSTRGLEALISANFKNEIIFINYSYSNFYWIFTLIFFAFVALFVGLGSKNLIFLFYSLLIILLSLLINYIFAVSYHLPDRLTFNFIYLALIGFLVLSLSEYSKIKNGKRFNNILFLLMTFLLSINAFQSIPKEFNARAESQKLNIEIFRQQSKILERSNENAIYVGTGSRLRYQWQDPYRAYENMSMGGKALLVGWHNLSPIWTNQVSQLSLNPKEFHQEFINNANLYWIDDESAMEGLQGFFQQYSQEPIVIEDKGSIGSDFYRIFKISTEP